MLHKDSCERTLRRLRGEKMHVLYLSLILKNKYDLFREKNYKFFKEKKKKPEYKNVPKTKTGNTQNMKIEIIYENKKIFSLTSKKENSH